MRFGPSDRRKTPQLLDGTRMKAMLLTKLKIATAALLCGVVLGLVLAARVVSSIWFSSTEPLTEVKEEAVYQGQPTSLWIGQLQDKSPAFRRQAVQALEHIGPKEERVVLALAKMLKDCSVGVRIGTALALGRFGSEAKSAIPAMIGCLKDPDRYVRVKAVRALGNISPLDPAVVAALISGLQDEESAVRRATLQTLGTIGPHAKLALPAISESRQDSDPEVSQEAVDALQKIDHQDGTTAPSSKGSTSGCW
jgi:hypothetical protein